jgi:hypothetical protein
MLAKAGRVRMQANVFAILALVAILVGGLYAVTRGASAAPPGVPPGQAAKAGELASGETLRGVYGLEAESLGAVQTAISYPLALSAPPSFNYLPPEAPATASCPGTVDQPEAMPGHLCVYARSQVNVLGVLIDFPAEFDSARYGVIVVGATGGNVDAVIKGTWAVTAP